MKRFFYVAISCLLLTAKSNIAFGEGASNLESPKTAQTEIAEYGREGAFLEIGGWFYSASSPRDYWDGKATVYQDGRLFVRTTSCETKETGYKFTDGPKSYVTNVFDSLPPCKGGKSCVVVEISSISTSDSDLDNLALKIVNTADGKEWCISYSPQGGGKFTPKL